MLRRVICYIIFLLNVIYIGLISFCFFNNEFLHKYLFLIYAGFIITLLFSILAIQLYGLPRNNYKEYLIKYISYREITERNCENIFIVKNNKKWIVTYKGREYIFDMRGWINQKKRVIDFIFIQFHNSYYNSKKIIKDLYFKNYFKKNKPQVKFIIKEKMYILKLKPSFILRLKMLIAVQRNPRVKSNELEHVKRDLFFTYLVLH